MSELNDEFSKVEDSGLKSVGRILVVDDEKNIRTTLNMVLTGQGYLVQLAGDGNEAEKYIASTPPDVILLDVRLPGRGGLELLKQWKIQFPNLPIILMSGEATLSEALEGLNIGAYDFIEKPFLTPRLVNAISRAIEKSNLRDLTESGQEERIIGSSEPLQKVLRDIGKIARTKTRVLITGESGTGKDLLARAIHQQSARAKQKFVKVNCAAIPSELIESELFGHTKGAFTGASSARRGLFERANGGTFFLDEVGELSLSAQAKMLRAIQNGEITPVGSDLSIQVDVRIVAATNRDLKAEVELGHFREDLFYRLAVLTIESPALRARKSDIPLLAEHFAKQISHENGFYPKSFDSDVMKVLVNYPWPGNIRELRNVIERLLILSGPTIHLSDLPRELMEKAQKSTVSEESPAGEEAFSVASWEDFKKDSERNYLIKVLKHCKGNVSEASRVLQVERSTVHKWVKLHQIEKHHFLF